MIDPVFAAPGGVFGLYVLAFILHVPAAVIINLGLVIDLGFVVLLGDLGL